MNATPSAMLRIEVVYTMYYKMITTKVKLERADIAGQGIIGILYIMRVIYK